MFGREVNQLNIKRPTLEAANLEGPKVNTVRLTAGQALIRYLMNQYVTRDGVTERFFPGIWGIFGHGNIGGVAQAIQQYEDDFPYYMCRNEQGMVHAAIGYSKMKNRMQAFACLTSIGPGATNMVTGAATATVDRIPVLLISGDSFAERVQGPVLQQVESEKSLETTANDTFRPVVRYWDRVVRPEQLITALPEVMRTLTSPADTGAAFLAMHQDVGTFAYDYPEQFFEPRVWRIERNRADSDAIRTAADLIRQAKRPLIVCGGGVRYSGAEAELTAFAETHGIPVAETHAGKGSINDDHSLSLGGAGVAGSRGANVCAEKADLVIGIGSRFTDFATASKTAFQNPDVKFVHINVFEMDAYKHGAIALTGDAKVTIPELSAEVGSYRTSDGYRDEISEHRSWWRKEVDRLFDTNIGTLPTQAQLIGAVVRTADPRDVVVTSAGSLPGDLLKLWRSTDSLSYQVEYGYSVMGYEIAGGIGAKMADPSREVYVMSGDASFLMMNSELATAVAEGVKIILILIDNHGYSSVGNVSEQVGCEGYGCHYVKRGGDGKYSGQTMHHDLAKICEGLGARTFSVGTLNEFASALDAARRESTSCAIVVETDWDVRVGGYATCWWDMATAEVSESPAVQEARVTYEREKKAQRWLGVEPTITLP
ncbi:MAG: 3D-(3,5/4)-trihydroxycyclohexane-1,2-dione acylhydrolase (decyclizing) [Actinobacteria bacterium]|nr:3D-(3,5/4)-trihydroxycyclohexane-1,2-dione acylhydrolase (decyclizing) [Actinomycetota bacterium]